MGLLSFPHLSPAVMEMECDGGEGVLHFPGVLVGSWAGKHGKTAGFIAHPAHCIHKEVLQKA